MNHNVPYLYQINVSDGGVPKYAVPEAWVSRGGVLGDRQRHRKIHGGPERALCLFSFELIAALRDEGHEIVPGASGENLTIAGLDWASVRPGVVIAVGPALRLEITTYTSPCRANARWFRSGDYRRISQERYPGWSRLYARVLAEATVRQGDPVTIEGRLVQRKERRR